MDYKTYFNIFELHSYQEQSDLRQEVTSFKNTLSIKARPRKLFSKFKLATMQMHFHFDLF